MLQKYSSQQRCDVLHVDTDRRRRLYFASEISGVIEVGPNDEHSTTSEPLHITCTSATETWYVRHSVGRQRTVSSDVSCILRNSYSWQPPRSFYKYQSGSV